MNASSTLAILLILFAQVCMSCIRQKRFLSINVSVNDMDILIEHDPLLSTESELVRKLASINGVGLIDVATLEQEIKRMIVRDSWTKMQNYFSNHDYCSNHWLSHADYISIRKYFADREKTELWIRKMTGSDEIESSVNQLLDSSTFDQCLAQFNQGKYYPVADFIRKIFLSDLTLSGNNSSVARDYLSMQFELCKLFSSSDCAVAVGSFLWSQSIAEIDIVVAKYRVLLLVPSITPFDYQVCRDDIVEDLIYFKEHHVKPVSSTIDISSLLSNFPSTPFHLAHQGLNDRQFQEVIGEIFGLLCPDLHFYSPFHSPSDTIATATATATTTTATATTTSTSTSQSFPLKIGFISTHFHNHSIGRMLIQLFQLLISSKAQKEVGLDVEFFIFHISSGVSSQYINGFPAVRNFIDTQDSVLSLYQSLLGDHFFHLPVDLPFIRNVVSSFGIDALVFTDIGMDMFTYSLSFSRLADYQIAWWGHPITTGLDSIDFFFTLDIEVKDADEHYKEQLVRMEHMNTSPLKDNNNQSLNNEFLLSIGLPKNCKYAAILGRLFKIHPLFLDACAVLLSKHSTFYIVLITESVWDWNEIVLRRWKKVMRAKNCLSCLSRIRFVDYVSYTEVIHNARLMLDTFPYGGCLTTHDALASGIPVVTLTTNYSRGQHSSYLLRQAGMTEYVAHSIPQYIEIADKLIEMNEDDWKSTHHRVSHLFHNQAHRPYQVALEWLTFFKTLFKSRYENP